MSSNNIYHRMKNLNARMVKNYRRGIGSTRVILLLTTTGRKSGLSRVTPLQYEKVGSDTYVASALGTQADWFKNILADPHVHVELQKEAFEALAEPVTDPERIAEFLELRLQRHPIMVRLIMHLADHLPLRFKHDDIVKLADRKALVILHPLNK
jgi:deazaflavin-dependent oxidoreductase (nitroreductase family)